MKQNTSDALPQLTTRFSDFQYWLALLLLTGVAWAIYRNSLHVPFIFDDFDSITGNRNIRTLWPIWKPMIAPPSSGIGGRPIVGLSLAISYALSGYETWGYHAVNLAIHVASTFLLYGIVRRTLLTPSLRPRFGGVADAIALTTALLWEVHPLLTESVTYISQRTELMMSFFALATLYCVIRGAGARSPARWYAAAVIACALAMGSKETAVGVPLLVLIFDRLFLSTSYADLFRRRRGLYAGLAASWLVLAIVLPMSSFKAKSGAGLDRLSSWDYLLTQSNVLVHYLRLAIWPTGLCIDYDDWPIAQSITAVLPQALLITALLALTTWAIWRSRPVGFLGAWFFIILAPTSSFLPLGTEVAAERRMYLPLAAVVAGVVIGSCALIERLVGRSVAARRAIGAAVVVTLVTLLGLATSRRNEDYASAKTIWSDTVAKRPGNARASINLGRVFFDEGNLDVAGACFARAITLRSPLPHAHIGLGSVYMSAGNFAQAQREFALAAREDPELAVARNNLGSALAAQGTFPEAEAAFAEALRLDPGYVECHVNLAKALTAQGKFEPAAAHCDEALRLEPNQAEVREDVAGILFEQHRLDEAIRQFQIAVQLNPNDPRLLARVAQLLAVDANRSHRNPSAAIKLAKRACDLTGNHDAALLDIYSACLAADGQFALAIETATRARTLAAAQDQTDLLKTIEQHLERYKSGRAM